MVLATAYDDAPLDEHLRWRREDANWIRATVKKVLQSHLEVRGIGPMIENLRQLLEQQMVLDNKMQRRLDEMRLLRSSSGSALI